MTEDRISAGELRAAGIEVPDNIPDVAGVPRSAVHFGKPDVTLEGDMAHISAPCTLSAPFKWISATFTISKERGGRNGRIV
jgi:hypothetical protein